MPKMMDYPCTDCGGDAFIGMTSLTGPSGPIIGKDERLCMRCCKKRGGFNPFDPKGVAIPGQVSKEQSYNQ